VLPIVAVLVAFGLPFTNVTFGAPDASMLPTSVQSRAGFDLLREHWGDGEVSPLVLVFQTTDGGSPLRPEHIGALYDFIQRVQADARVVRIESLVSIDPRLTGSQYQRSMHGPRRSSWSMRTLEPPC
jgi:putative drug exporter of the RND superfamily